MSQPPGHPGRKSAEPLPLSDRARFWLARLPSFGAEFPADLAERFPHVAERIASAWGDPIAMRDTMADLLFDQRSGRHGFPESMHAALVSAQRAHARAFPSPAVPSDFWSHSGVD